MAIATKTETMLHHVDEHKQRGTPQNLDAEALAHDLEAKIEGEVRFDAGSRALYATDGSNYRQVPIGVVIPRTIDDVVQTVKLCRRYGAPVLSRGCGTSLAGQCCNVAVIMDFSKYLNNLVKLDPNKKQARVQPGIILDSLRDAAEKHNLTFGPDPATHSHCTLGGMMGNNSCGVHSVMAGKTVDNIDELEVLTYDGLRLRVGKTSDEELERIIREGGRQAAIYARMKELRDKYADQIRKRYPNIPRRVSGYNLDQLLPENGFNVARALIGSEGTLVTILEVTTRLVYSPPVRSLLVLGYPDVYSAGDHVMEVLAHKPIGLEGLDDRLVDDMKAKGLHPSNLKLLPDGGGWLLVEFGGESKEEADDKAHGLMDDLKGKGDAPSMKLYDDPHEEHLVWIIRESGLGATADVPGQPNTWPGWEDSAVPPEKVGPYLRDLRKLFDRYGYECDLYGHFGQGCIHVRIDFDMVTQDGITRFRAFLDDAADLVVSYGGSLSGEHGDGQARAALLPKMFGDELVHAFGEFKAIWDPEGKMNPGKIVDPYTPTQNLRLGTGYNPPQPVTHFKFPQDGHSFAKATLRCVGVGDCRRLGGGTMCPSFMVTREEKHSTRGRARLLFEMMQGNPLHDGWHSDAVREALDLCLACKGCKGDCPVNVDMATYKAEFYSHYYAGKLRPIAAYSMGLIYWWARLASHFPHLANFVTQTPLLSDAFKALGGVAPQRRVPAFAPQTFKAWFEERGGSHPKGNRQRKEQHARRDGHEQSGASHNSSQGDTQQGVSSASAHGSGENDRHEHTGHFATSQTPPSLPPYEKRHDKVILWPDTFNNYFMPETAKAAVEVLEDAGLQVIVPQQSLCCGRPLYDWGMLNAAKLLLRQILDTLRPEIQAGTPVVGLEPSCVSVFRDELVNLFPGDMDAKRLSEQTFLFSEFLERLSDYQPPKLHRKAVVHGHCHHKAIMKMDDEQTLFADMGLDYSVLTSGCCGMAGAFGFEKGEHYDVSIKAGERVLLPAVRKADKDTLIVADGFSCREQIAQDTDRHALHVAQVLQMALHSEDGDSSNGRAEEYPETNYIHRTDTTEKLKRAAWGAGAVASGLLLAFAGRALKKF